MAPGKRRRGLLSLKNAFNYRNPQSLKLTRLESSASRSECNPVSCFQCEEIHLPSTRPSLSLLRLAVVSPAIRFHDRSSKQDAFQGGASANYCASLGLVASVISKERCCPTFVFSLI